MAVYWIVHRDAHARSALARLAGLPDVLVGAPSDPRFETAPAPSLVVLGVAGDFELELEFVHRFLARVGDAGWVLVPEAADLEETRRLFDAIPAELLPFPPTAGALRERLRAAQTRRSAEPVSSRRLRDAVARSFARLFGDLELPELLAALDPRRAEVPLLIRGEPGTGRSLLARYVHLFGAGPRGAGPFVSIPCGPETRRDDLLEALARADADAGGRGRVTLCLEEVECLRAVLQRELRGWVELGPPAGVVRGARVRWIAIAGEPGRSAPGRALDAELERALACLSLDVPPLRARRDAIPAIAETLARAWAETHGERPTRLAPDAIDALRDHPWPGNVRELESVLARTLALERADPVCAEHLRFEAGGAGPARPAAPTPRVEPLPEEEPALRDGESAEEELLAEVEAIPEEPAPAEPRAEATEAPAGPALRHIASAVAHEVRNPLVAIRTFAELLPERFEDPDFRRRFVELVAGDAERIQAVVDRLARFASLGRPRPERVDVAALLESLLEERRAAVGDRRLLVLNELDRERPLALADPEQLRFAFGALLDRAVALVPERGNLYLASKHHPTGLGGGPCVRVLLRLQRPPGAGAGPVEGLTPEETTLEIPIAVAVVRSQGGSAAVDAGRADEVLVLLDLPAPPAG